MKKDYRFILEYIEDGAVKTCDKKDCDLYSIKETFDGSELHVTIEPKKPIELKNAYLTCAGDYRDDDRIYVNGYQSWTTSREYQKTDIQPGLMGLGQYRPVWDFTHIFGDYDFQHYSKKPGVFHSYSYTYIKRDGKIILMGTLTERTGFTVFHFDMPADSLCIQKDVEGVTITGSYALFDLYCVEDEYDAAFDAYFDKLNIRKPRFDRMTGYTSWYNYYGNITEKILLRDLDGLKTLGDKASIFQIDDGYQVQVGDWLTLKQDKYPNGMKPIVDKIHSYGYKAGLWLAPFNAQKSKSMVARDHIDWMVKGPNGKPEIGCIAWGGAYTLDIDIPEAKEYVRKVFRGVFDEWGFDMVKLDFLYSICHTPRHNKSRGQLMTEAMEFLRECAGEKIILGCGVPLFPSFGLVDFCRISSDVGKSYKDPFFQKHSNQEIFSTRCAMNNSIFRRHLDGRAFRNDPDVFYLRDCDLSGKDDLWIKKTGKLKFTKEQKYLLAEVNSMCGNVLFVSDNVGGYDDEQRAMVEKCFTPTDRKVLDAEFVAPTKIDITYVDGKGEKFVLNFDTVTGENSTKKL
ncbi:MAG: alpha-galactosidase [Clostridia bacterium]|nr:alpha-galactosidase [Clostridia bacterium]